ncbi:MAG: xylulose kinase, partial [Anaerolineae bacterium]
MSDSPFILAIDLGTSGPKVALVSGEGEVIAADFERVEQIFLPGGGAEQRPEDWWTAIVTATRRLLAGGRVGAADIAAICCTSLYSTTVPVGEDGRPLANAIMWMDTRGAPYVRRLVGGVPSVEGYGLGKLIPWLRLTGGVPTRSGKDSLAHILYLKHEHPEIYRRARFFLEPKDYLNLRMCGRAAATYDSINLHWLTDNRDIHHIRYHERLLQMADVDGEKLPPLVSGLEVLGTLRPEAAEELGLRPEVRVVAGVTDAQSAAIGAGAIENYVTYLYLGTSSWISCHVPFKKTDLLHNMASLPSVLPGRYYVANEQECAGVCLDFLRESVLGMDLPSAEAYRALDRAAEEAPPGSGGVIFTPWLYGERTPIEDPNVRGGFFNLSLNTTRSELIRAVFEGVAYNARWLLECVERFV